MLTGDPQVGALLTAHELIEKIAFTGSGPTGSKVMTEAARRITNVCLELGGKSSLIIFDDVEIEKAVEWVHLSRKEC